MIVGITISNSQVYFLRVFSLKSTPHNFVANEGIYSVGKDLVKQNITFCQIKSFTIPSRVSLTRETLMKISSLAQLFIFQSCSLHVAFSRISFSRDTREIHQFILLSLSLCTLSHSSLTIKNPHTCREYMIEEITIKFGTKLKPTQNSCKLQLYSKG